MIDFAEFRILVVTDAAAGDGEVTELLRRAGYSNISVSADPADTQRLCLTEHPDLVLLDLNPTGALGRRFRTSDS